MKITGCTECGHACHCASGDCGVSNCRCSRCIALGSVVKPNRKHVDALWAKVINRIGDSNADLPQLLGTIAELVLEERKLYTQRVVRELPPPPELGGPPYEELKKIWDGMVQRVEHEATCKDPQCRHDDDPPSLFETHTVGSLKVKVR